MPIRNQISIELTDGQLIIIKGIKWTEQFTELQREKITVVRHLFLQKKVLEQTLLPETAASFIVLELDTSLSIAVNVLKA